MTVWPGPEYVNRARATARAYAYTHGQGHLAEDFEQEATIALLRHWPRLTRNYGPTPGRRLMRAAVRNWCVDYQRVELGRTGARRQVPTVPFPSLPGWEPASSDDTASDACRRVSDLDRILDLVVEAQRPERKRSLERRRQICRWHAEGRSGVWIAGELGISEFGVSRLLTETLEAAREDRHVQRLAV